VKTAFLVAILLITSTWTASFAKRAGGTCAYKA